MCCFAGIGLCARFTPGAQNTNHERFSAAVTSGLFVSMLCGVGSPRKYNTLPSGRGIPGHGLWRVLSSRPIHTPLKTGPQLGDVQWTHLTLPF